MKVIYEKKTFQKILDARLNAKLNDRKIDHIKLTREEWLELHELDAYVFPYYQPYCCYVSGVKVMRDY